MYYARRKPDAIRKVPTFQLLDVYCSLYKKLTGCFHRNILKLKTLPEVFRRNALPVVHIPDHKLRGLPIEAFTHDFIPVTGLAC